MATVCLVNGREGVWLDPLDRAAQYGDGVFRTLRLVDGQPRWLDEQLAKLATDAASLGIAAPVEAEWRADLEQLAGRLSTGVLKLLLTRGPGERGYRPPDAGTPTRIVMHDPGPPMSDHWPEVGLHVRLCELRLSEQPRLAGIKHLNRLENVLARAEWDDPDIHEGLLRDAAGRVVSGVMSNLFLWWQGRLRTPRLDRCGVAGVTRARLMRRAAEAGIVVEEGDYGLDEVIAAEAVMLCNSVIGLRRVARLGRHHWSQSPHSERLWNMINA
jgi:4-amino-4-deoxychorismate lyase